MTNNLIKSIREKFHDFMYDYGEHFEEDQALKNGIGFSIKYGLALLVAGTMIYLNSGCGNSSKSRIENFDSCEIQNSEGVTTIYDFNRDGIIDCVAFPGSMYGNKTFCDRSFKSRNPYFTPRKLNPEMKILAQQTFDGHQALKKTAGKLAGGQE